MKCDECLTYPMCKQRYDELRKNHNLLFTLIILQIDCQHLKDSLRDSLRKIPTERKRKPMFQVEDPFAKKSIFVLVLQYCSYIK